MALDKNGIAKRIAKELKDGYYVNLGIGNTQHWLPIIYQKEWKLFYIPKMGLLVLRHFQQKKMLTLTLFNGRKADCYSNPGISIF